MTMDVLPRADTIEERLNRAQLGLLSDEGLRSWYVKDVADLLQQLTAVRRERADTAMTLRKLPIEPALSTREEAEQAVKLFEDATAGLWQKAEVVRLREKTAAAVAARQDAEQRATQADVARFKAEEQAEQARRDMLEARQQQQQAVAEMQRLRTLSTRARQLLAEAAHTLP